MIATMAENSGRSRSLRRSASVGPPATYNQLRLTSSRLRNIKYCTEINLPHHLMCYGCSRWSEKPRTVSRDAMSEKFACFKPWMSKAASSNRGTSKLKNCKSVQEQIIAHLKDKGWSESRLTLDDDALDTTEAEEERGRTLTPHKLDGRKKPRTRKDVPITSTLVRSFGFEFRPKIPNTHQVVARSSQAKVEKEAAKMQPAAEPNNVPVTSSNHKADSALESCQIDMIIIFVECLLASSLWFLPFRVFLP